MGYLSETRFPRHLEAAAEELAEGQLRRLVLACCARYMAEHYCEPLEEALDYLKAVQDGTDISAFDMEAIRADVDEAMAEFCESLNESAMAIDVLLTRPAIDITDACEAIEHILNAYACNEAPEDFLAREDAFLCAALERF
jgi:hypothetical protein